MTIKIKSSQNYVKADPKRYASFLAFYPENEENFKGAPFKRKDAGTESGK